MSELLELLLVKGGINGKNLVRICLIFLVYISHLGYNLLSDIHDTQTVMAQQIKDDHEALQRLEIAFLGVNGQTAHIGFRR